MSTRTFRQVDVFTDRPYFGNPVAVVLDGDGLDDDAMDRFARWTNLSETTFVQTATDSRADYRLRIFTPNGELPFAGHPTLGSAHAWLQDRPDGGPDEIVQECGVGLVRLRRTPGGLAFAAPELLRSGPVDADTRAAIARALHLDPAIVRDHSWVDNGPGWVAVLLDSAESVLAVEPDFAAFDGLRIGAVGPYPPGSECAYEVRGFAPDLGAPEDPVTGSLNASIAQWLIGEGHAPASYLASQGTVLGRAGRVRAERTGDEVWIGGASTTCISGTVEL